MRGEAIVSAEKERFIEEILGQHRNIIGTAPNNINRGACESCGGFCCKTAPCALMPCDITDMSVDGIKDMLNTGKYSLRVCKFYSSDYLVTMCSRQVNVGRVTDSLLFNACALLTESGCPFSDEDRPTGALLLIPNMTHRCRYILSDERVFAEWKKYEDILNQVLFDEIHKTPQETFVQNCKNTIEYICKKYGSEIPPKYVALCNECFIEIYMHEK